MLPFDTNQATNRTATTAILNEGSFQSNDSYNIDEEQSFGSSAIDGQQNPIQPEMYIPMNGSKFSFTVRLQIGCAYNSGMSANELSIKYGCSVQYIYELGRQATIFLSQFEQSDLNENTQIIVVDRTYIEATCIFLSVACQASLEDVQIYLKTMLNYETSVSTISRIRNKHANTAQAFNSTVDLSPIKVGANDEIFFGQTPVLTGIDLKSTYIYSLDIAPDRTAETWQLQMMLLQDQGLTLETSISDAGNGLLKGIGGAFPECHIQIDVFHTLYETGKVVCGIKEKVFSFLKDLYAAEWQILYGKRVFEKTCIRHAQMEKETDVILSLCDQMIILDSWMKEILSFPGYTAEESMSLLEWIANEFTHIAELGNGLQYVKFFRLKSAAETLKNRIPRSQEYLVQLENNMKKRAKELNIQPEVFRAAYRMRTMGIETQVYQQAADQINTLIRQKPFAIGGIMAELDGILKNTYKASSLVENLNSRLRTLINDMRVLTYGMASLIRLYMNTKPYRRSNVLEREGKSPLEMLNGDKSSFMDIIFPGFCPVYVVTRKKLTA